MSRALYTAHSELHLHTFVIATSSDTRTQQTDVRSLTYHIHTKLAENDGA